MNDLTYFSSGNKEHGYYQYISLKDIIDNMQMEAQNEDSYIKNVKRYNMVRYAKNAIQDLYQSGVEILAKEYTVGSNLTMILPRDFVNYVRVSVVEIQPNGAYRLRPLDINYRINTAEGYLQDHDLSLIFDERGNVVTADGVNATSTPYKTYSFSKSCCGGNSIPKDEFTQNGMFTIDRRQGKIFFSSELYEKNIVLEYISDGDYLDDNEIYVHKNLRQTIEDYIFFASIERLRNVPNNQKFDAHRKYKASRHKAMLLNAEITPIRIARAL